MLLKCKCFVIIQKYVIFKDIPIINVYCRHKNKKQTNISWIVNFLIKIFLIL